MNRFTLSWRLHTGKKRPAHARPLLERLEERTVLSTLIPVTRDADSGAGSLRQAILDYNSATDDCVIQFHKNVHNITLTGGELTINNVNNKGLDIEGPGANTLTISGNDSSRVFDVLSGSVTIAGVTITHGKAGTETVLSSHGGGILNNTDAHLTLTGVVLSHNTAQGILNINDELRHLGGGAGGGVANTGYLTVTGCTFIDNHAVGADGQNPIDGVIRFPGIGLGGGLWNWMTGTATVTDSRFIDNLAQAGSHCTGTFAGLANGGAIYNDNDLTVAGSLFTGNHSIGGDDTTPSPTWPPVWSGPATGGAISSGTNERLIGEVESAVLNVSQCIFSDNEAHGGNESVAGPQGAVPGAGTALGGAILVFQGEATISQSVLDHNQAIGGKGAPGQVGGLAIGGGILFFNFLSRPTVPVTGVMGTVKDCALVGNEAIGGTGGDDGGRGGNALGGGIAAGTFGVSPLSGEVAVSNTLVAGNLARGGDGGLGGNGGLGGDSGTGMGGGVYKDAGSAMTVTHSSIIFNLAVGGKGQGAGRDGQGIGGGVYFADGGMVCLDSYTVKHIVKNHASTSDDNIFGSYTIS
jgi:hypothetical protein